MCATDQQHDAMNLIKTGKWTTPQISIFNSWFWQCSYKKNFLVSNKKVRCKLETYRTFADNSEVEMKRGAVMQTEKSDWWVKMLVLLKSMTIRLTGRMMLIFNIHDNQQIKLILWTDQEVTHTYITMNIYMNPLTYTHMHACEYTESTNALMLFSIKDRYLVMIICILKKKKAVTGLKHGKSWTKYFTYSGKIH